MPKLLVCQHVAWEPLGTLDPRLRGSGFRIRYVNFGRDSRAQPTLDGYGGLVILGGPMNVDDVERHPHLATEVSLVLDALERKIPVLGICLGAQLIAKALGARVRAADRKEIGWHDVSLSEGGKRDPVLGHLGAETRLFQWHGDVFDLPGGRHIWRARSAVRARPFVTATTSMASSFTSKSTSRSSSAGCRSPRIDRRSKASAERSIPTASAPKRDRKFAR